MIVSKLLKSLQAVVYKNVSGITSLGIFSLIDNGIGAAFFKRSRGKGVSVEGFALQSQEN